LNFVSTGSLSFDKFLHGGIRTGMITNIIGESGSGKSQFCFTVCANLLKNNSNVNIIFIDTAGTFRPERIIEIYEDGYSNRILKNIKYFRPYTINHQFDAINKINELQPKLVIVDTITSIIAVESKNISRHLILMKFIHKLAHLAIKHNCAIITTNMVRNIIPSNHINNNKKENTSPREYMEKSTSLSVHIKLKFEILSISNNVYAASFLQPLLDNNKVFFKITKAGII